MSRKIGNGRFRLTTRPARGGVDVVVSGRIQTFVRYRRYKRIAGWITLLWLAYCASTAVVGCNRLLSPEAAPPNPASPVTKIWEHEWVSQTREVLGHAANGPAWVFARGVEAWPNVALMPGNEEMFRRWALGFAIVMYFAGLPLLMLFLNRIVPGMFWSSSLFAAPFAIRFELRDGQGDDTLRVRAGGSTRRLSWPEHGFRLEKDTAELQLFRSKAERQRGMGLITPWGRMKEQLAFARDLLAWGPTQESLVLRTVDRQVGEDLQLALVHVWQNIDEFRPKVQPKPPYKPNRSKPLRRREGPGAAEPGQKF